MKRLAEQVLAKLAALDAEQRRRSLRPLDAAGCTIDLTHNDYMGLRADQDFQRRAHAAAQPWPVGSGASRLLGGEHEVYECTEKQFASWKGAESALYFPSGYAANEGLMGALNLGDAAFFSDELNHASLIDGMRLARLRPEQKHIFRHNDCGHLRELLQASKASIKIIVVESLYSMDGDLCPALELANLAAEFAATLVVDEAHALGVYGPEGEGWMAACGIDPETYISVNPCGKGMAASGAFICGPLWLRDLLINTARSFIYTTGASPWIAAALQESVRTIRTLHEARATFHKRVQDILLSLRGYGFDTGASTTHIIPIILGSEAKTLTAEAFCRERGIEARAIRPPTVAPESCRLRISLHAALTARDQEQILEVFRALAAGPVDREA